jgi:hypothetical protein
MIPLLTLSFSLSSVVLAGVDRLAAEKMSFISIRSSSHDV